MEYLIPYVSKVKQIESPSTQFFRFNSVTEALKEQNIIMVGVRCDAVIEDNPEPV